MPSKRVADDDFVLTLSDNDDLPVSDVESDIENVPSSASGTKRKRETEKLNGAHKKQKKLKKTKVTDQDADSGSESSAEDLNGVKDGAMDSDFEFDMGYNAVTDNVEDFDGWGDGEKDPKTIKKRGVDIDDLIARRAAKKEVQNGKAKALKVADSSDIEDHVDVGGDRDDEENDEASDEDEEIQFEDETLATDTFGAGAASDDEEEERPGAADQQSDDEDDSEDDAGSDNDSTASPVAHPDDLASESDSDNESRASTSDAEEAAKRAAFFAPDESSSKTTTGKGAESFQQFSISRPILRALAALSFTAPTPVQLRTIPIALQGLDVVGSAQTGSGKTAAFLVPILERLLYRPRKIPTTRVAILMPTRELAVQCHSVATALARFTDITFAQVVGGFSLREQETVLRKRPDVVIATPGRFIDHMRNSASFVVENLEILVLDEADRMLEQGFADELDEILRTIPKSRQTMLFSATMTDTVDKLVRIGMNRPVRVSVDAKRSTVAGLTQEFLRLRPGREEMRLASLCVLSTTLFTERTIVFFRQKKEAHRVRVIFGLLGLKAAELHGSMTQEQRIDAVNSFRDGRSTHLLATDLASRGLDIKNVLSVINYEAPQSHEIYVHRVGRTARAGRSGRSCTIAAEPDRKVVKAAVKAGRSQGAKIVSRVLEADEVSTMHRRIEELEDEIEEILKEEKQEKQIAQLEQDVTRGENMVKHQDEIMARPKRTWFESEKEKQVAKDKGRAELNGVLFKGEKKKLSNKDRKKLDLHEERVSGRQWKKGKGDAEHLKSAKKGNKSSKAGVKGKPRGKRR